MTTIIKQLFLLLSFGYTTVSAQLPGRKDSIIVGKSFPVLTMLYQYSDAAPGIHSIPQFAAIKDSLLERASSALQNCSTTACLATALKWSLIEMESAGNEMVRLYHNDLRFKVFVSELKEKGSYKLYESSDTALIRNAWQDAVLGLNRIIEVYLEGETPRYPKIDSISYLPSDPTFFSIVSDDLNDIMDDCKKAPPLFFEFTLKSALKLLEINGRDEAARYEPLTGGMNAAPFGAIHETEWEQYPYSTILVPGQGPSNLEVALDPLGAYKCEAAARYYNQGMAPFIIVSGGHVHPYKTPYCEAVEMKKYLIGQLGVPSHAVFIEPHARHTTTNLRNASRMIFRYGIPPDKPVMIVTNEEHNDYIQGIEKRCLDELGYIPYKDLKRMGKLASRFYPVTNVLQADPYDPLDP